LPGFAVTWFAADVMVELAEVLPEFEDDLWRVVRNEPRTASSSS
jgi:hypothetical protein